MKDKYMDLVGALENHFSLHDTDMIFNLLMSFLSSQSFADGREIDFDEFLEEELQCGLV